MLILKHNTDELTSEELIQIEQVSRLQAISPRCSALTVVYIEVSALDGGP